MPAVVDPAADAVAVPSEPDEAVLSVPEAAAAGVDGLGKSPAGSFEDGATEAVAESVSASEKAASDPETQPESGSGRVDRQAKRAAPCQHEMRRRPAVTRVPLSLKSPSPICMAPVGRPFAAASFLQNEAPAGS